jgi:hypothetical protein
MTYLSGTADTIPIKAMLAGDHESYGMQDIYDITADDELTVWVEDYGLSKEDALEQFVNNCE